MLKWRLLAVNVKVGSQIVTLPSLERTPEIAEHEDDEGQAPESRTFPVVAEVFDLAGKQCRPVPGTWQRIFRNHNTCGAATGRA